MSSYHNRGERKMKSLVSSKKQRTPSGNASLFGSSSISSRKRSRRRNSTKEVSIDGDEFMFRLSLSGGNPLFCSASMDTMAFIAVLVLSILVIMISRLNCFHVHYGMNNSLSNIKRTGSTVNDGRINFHFRGDVKTTFDQEALDLMKENPWLKIEDLDLGFVFDMDQLGSDIMAFVRNYKGRRSSTIESIGKSTNEIVFHITGERIRNALQQREAIMPRPSQK